MDTTGLSDQYVRMYYTLVGIIAISYAMGTYGLSDIYTLSPWVCGPQALSVYIRKTTRAHGITITYLINR